jgi:hypothetical protein
MKSSFLTVAGRPTGLGPSGPHVARQSRPRTRFETIPSPAEVTVSMPLSGHACIGIEATAAILSGLAASVRARRAAGRPFL